MRRHYVIVWKESLHDPHLWPPESLCPRAGAARLPLMQLPVLFTALFFCGGTNEGDTRESTHPHRVALLQEVRVHSRFLKDAINFAQAHPLLNWHSFFESQDHVDKWFRNSCQYFFLLSLFLSPSHTHTLYPPLSFALLDTPVGMLFHL